MTGPRPAHGSATRTLAALFAVVVMAGCGSSHHVTTSPSTTHSTTETTSSATSSASGSQPRSGPAAPPGSAALGHARRVHAGRSTLTVTVTRVYSRLPHTGSALVPGSHAAAVALTIFNAAGATYDSTASGDVSLQTSAGMAAPLFIRHGVCQTPLVDFESLIEVGETRSGCVGFTIARGARLVAVRFSPHSRTVGSVTWAAGSGG